MSTKPSLILTRLDVQRLERLIDSLDESTPGVLALQGELDRAEQVVGHEEVPAGVVTMNSRVHCREEASGKDFFIRSCVSPPWLRWPSSTSTIKSGDGL